MTRRSHPAHDFQDNTMTEHHDSSTANRPVRGLEFDPSVVEGVDYWDPQYLDDLAAGHAPTARPTRYRLMSPAEAVQVLAAGLPGGQTDAREMLGQYLQENTGVHGRPDGGWCVDADDQAEIRARFSWVDTAGGDTLAAARERAEHRAVKAVRAAAGTSAITDHDALARHMDDAEMWGYRAGRASERELSAVEGCAPVQRYVTLGREGRELSPRDATAAAQARTDQPRTDDQPDTHDPGDGQNSDQGDDDRRGDPVAQTRPDDAGDRERALTEGPGAFAGGMWFTPDPDTAGGVRPLTEAELHRFSGLVRTSQAEVLAEEHDDRDAAGWPLADDSTVDGAVDAQGRER